MSSEQDSSRPLAEIGERAPIEYDLRLLTATYLLSLNDTTLECIKSASREGAQLLVNKIFSLHIDRKEPGVCAILPPAVTPLPRSKPLPKRKPLTKWERFAKEKGIKPVKKHKMRYSSDKEDFEPRWGYKSNDPQSEWLLELKSNEDPTVDKFKTIKDEKKARINSNKARNRKNTDFHNNELRKTTDFHNNELRKTQLKKDLRTARLSTASLGRFAKPVFMEDSVKIKKLKQKKDQVTITKKELETRTKLSKSLTSKSTLNVKKAIKNLPAEVESKVAKNAMKAKKRKSARIAAR